MVTNPRTPGSIVGRSSTSPVAGRTFFRSGHVAANAGSLRDVADHDPSSCRAPAGMSLGPFVIASAYERPVSRSGIVKLPSPATDAEEAPSRAPVASTTASTGT